MWTLVLVFVLQGNGYLTSATVPGFNSLEDCRAQGNALLQDVGKPQIIIGEWACVDSSNKSKEIKK